MNLNDLSTQLLFTTAQIWSKRSDNSVQTGTAFFYNYVSESDPNKVIPFLITNYHVIRDGRKGVVELSEGSDAATPKIGSTVRVEVDLNIPHNYINEKLDIAIIPIGHALNALKDNGKIAFYRSIGKELLPNAIQISELAALEEIVFIGYPSGLRDKHSGLPIIRRGITASPVWSNFDGKSQFLIDAGVFPGSSGSPVFILNQGSYSTKNGISIGSRLMFLGVLTQSMLRPESSANVYLGLGIVAHSREVVNFIDDVGAELFKQLSNNTLQ